MDADEQRILTTEIGKILSKLLSKFYGDQIGFILFIDSDDDERAGVVTNLTMDAVRTLLKTSLKALDKADDPTQH